MKKITTLALLCLAISSCDSSKLPIPTINETPKVETSAIIPLEILKIKPKLFKVSAINATKIELPNGGSIAFDAYSFVQNGKAVTEPVTIEWQEFHSLTDIMCSGIPMTYTENGQTGDMVSGGMFTIKGKLNNEDVEIAENKNATVTLGSMNETKDFNFYNLNESTGDWTFKQATTAAINPNFKPRFDSEPEVSSLDNSSKSHIFDAELNVSAFPELKNKEIIGWKTADEVKNKKQLTNIPSDSKLSKTENPNVYTLEIANKSQTFSYQVTPYLLADAVADSKNNILEVEKEIQDVLAYQENVIQGKVLRTMPISGFGTYNWDRIKSRTEAQTLQASFEIPGNPNLKIVSLFLITPEENLVIKIDGSYNNYFGFDKTKKCGLVAILPDNTLAIVPSDDFKGLGSLPKNSPHLFKFKKSNISLNSGQDLSAAVQSLI